MLRCSRGKYKEYFNRNIQWWKASWRIIWKIHYTFKENWDENRAVHKTVFWYLMKARSMDTIPQKEEGFIDAKFIHLDRVVDLARYDDEKEIIKVALQEIKKRIKNNS